MFPTILRGLGKTHIVDILEDARRARENKTSSDEDFEAAAGSPAVDGAVALDKAGGNLGGATKAAAEREDLKKNCWLCRTNEQAVQLRVCSGCHKVRLVTSIGSFLSSLHTNVRHVELI